MLTTDAYSNQSGRPGAASLQPVASAADTHSMQLRASGVLRNLWAAALCLFALTSAATAHAQAAPTAVRSSDAQAGVGFVLAAPDYTERTFKGITGYASFDFKYHYGVEFDFHQAWAPSPSDLYERTYEIGPRYVRHYGRFHPYAKAMYGRGVFNYEFNVANLAYNLGAIGAGVDMNATRRINIRADYEYQHWFSFRGFVSQGNVTDTSSSLTPQVFTIGAAYHFQ